MIATGFSGFFSAINLAEVNSVIMKQPFLDWIELDSLFSQGKPLADDYTKHPENENSSN